MSISGCRTDVVAWASLALLRTQVEPPPSLWRNPLAKSRLSADDIEREAAKRKAERIAQEGVPPLIALEQRRQELLKEWENTTEKPDNEGKKR